MPAAPRWHRAAPGDAFPRVTGPRISEDHYSIPLPLRTRPGELMQQAGGGEPTTNVGAPLRSSPGPRAGGAEGELGVEGGRGQVAGSGCAQRGAPSLGSRQLGGGGGEELGRGRQIAEPEGVREVGGGGDPAQAGKGAQEMGAKGRSEKLRRRKSSLEEEGQRGSEKGVFALWRAQGRSLLRAGRGRPTRRGPRGGGVGAAVPAALPEALLPRRVPQLQLDPLARLDLQQAGEEVHADRGVAGGRAQPREAALREAVQEARLAHRRVPDHDEAELIDPDGLHGSRAPAGRPARLPSSCRASLAAGTVPSAPPGRPPAGFQHIPATAAAAWSPPSLEGGAGPGRPRGGASGQGAGRAGGGAGLTARDSRPRPR